MSLSDRADFVLFFDVTDGNPNGDPDADNQPRVDPETGHGLVTHVALKRRVRDYVSLSRAEAVEMGQEIYVKHRGILANEQRRAYEAIGLTTGSDRPNTRAREWMCRRFWDVRTFGAVMTAGRASAASGLKLLEPHPRSIVACDRSSRAIAHVGGDGGRPSKRCGTCGTRTRSCAGALGRS